MSTDDVLYEIQRTLGRIEARLDGQDHALAELKTDVSALKAKPARQWGAVGRWVGTVAATIVAAFVVFRLKLRG